MEAALGNKYEQDNTIDTWNERACKSNYGLVSCMSFGTCQLSNDTFLSQCGLLNSRSCIRDSTGLDQHTLVYHSQTESLSLNHPTIIS